MSLFHPAADLFQLMEDVDLQILVEDIKKNGLREPIWTINGAILDGRNRERACEKAGVKPVYREWPGPESGAIAFVLSQNLHRRHLTVSQRAMLAVRLKTMLGDQVVILPPGKKSRDVAAEAMGISPSSVQHAVKIVSEAEPALAEAVAGGKIVVSKAARLADLPPDEQLAAIKAAESEVQQRVLRNRAKEPKKVVLHLPPKVYKLLQSLCKKHKKDQVQVFTMALKMLAG
jgi:ParB-like chromosome segregation protein Spo0J